MEPPKLTGVWTALNVGIAVALLVICFGINEKFLGQSSAEHQAAIDRITKERHQAEREAEIEERVADGQSVPIKSYNPILGPDEKVDGVVLTMPDGNAVSEQSSYRISDEIEIRDVKWHDGWGTTFYQAPGQLFVHGKSIGAANIQIADFIQCADGSIEYKEMRIYPGAAGVAIKIPTQNPNCYIGGDVPPPTVPERLAS